MSFSTPVVSSTRQRPRRAAHDWATCALSNTAKSRRDYVECCINSIIARTNAAATAAHVYYSPFRPERAAAARRLRARDAAVVVDGLQQRWLPNHPGVGVACALCAAVVPHARLADARLLKNVHARHPWSLVCAACAAKI